MLAGVDEATLVDSSMSNFNNVGFLPSSTASLNTSGTELELERERERERIRKQSPAYQPLTPQTLSPNPDKITLTLSPAIIESSKVSPPSSVVRSRKSIDSAFLFLFLCRDSRPAHCYVFARTFFRLVSLRFFCAALCSHVAEHLVYLFMLLSSFLLLKLTLLLLRCTCAFSSNFLHLHFLLFSSFFHFQLICNLYYISVRFIQ